MADFFSDDFSGESLDTAWLLEGLVGSATLANSTQDSYLELVVPDGGTYDAWGANNTSVRLMQAATDADFGVEAKFLSTPSQRFETQGILVEQDAQNWIRFDTFHDGTSLNVFAAVTVNGVSSSRIYQAVTPGSASHVRVTRVGDTWTYEYSGDGQTWTTAGSFTHAMTVTAVGLFAGSSDVSPGFTAQVDYFFNTAAPIVPEDQMPPVAQDDTIAAAAGAALVIDVAGDLLANDSDPTGDTLTLVGFTQPVNGTLVDNGDGTLTYTSNTGFLGADSFTYTVSDGFGTDTATVTAMVTAPGNDAPVAADDAFTTFAGISLTIGAPGILLNDSDPDGDALAALLVTDVVNGTLDLNADGSFTYTPAAGFTGTDSFTYTADDGNGGTANATVTVDVTAPPGGFASDDFSGASLSGLWSLQGPVGTANLAAAGSDMYLEIVVPDGGTYDAWGASNTTARVMQAATAGDFGIEAKFLSTPSARFEIQGILVEQDANNWIRFDTFHDGSALRIFSAVTVNGVSSVKIYQGIAPGSASHLRVTHSGDSWTYQYSADGQNWTTAGSFNQALAVTAVGPFAGSSDAAPGYTAQLDYFFNTAAPIVPEDALPPVAQDDTAATAMDTALVLSVAGDLLANDSDPNGDPLTLTGFSQPANGTLADNGDGTLTYTPNAGFAGVDSFAYTVSDGTDTDTASVTVTVTDPSNTPPAATADGATTSEDAAIAVGVLVNDSDPNGDPLTIAAVTDPANGTAVIDDGGTPGDPSDDTIVYTPDPDFSGVDTFTYTIADGRGGSDSATVTVTVDPVNDAPVAVDDGITAYADTPLTVAAPGILSNDSDADGDALAASLVTDVTNGTLALNASGGFTYTPNAGFTGIDSFTYTADDGNGGTANATVTIDVLSLPGGFASDDFDGPSLGAAWSFQGPAGAANLAAAGHDSYLEIVVPDGGTYDAWGANNTSARIMQAATDGDFGIEAGFLSTPSARYEIQGILVEQDAQNWIRFDTFHDGSTLRLFSAVTVNGVSSMQIHQAIPQDGAAYLRVTRAGDEWTLERSADGQNWITAGSFNHALIVTAVGPFAGSADSAPGFTAQVDYFFNTVAPIVPEDPLPPEAQDDTAATAAATPLVLSVSNDLLANDSDPNGQPLALDSFTQPANGTLADNGDGTLTYTPNAGFSGVDSFDYTVSDGTATDTGTVRVAVDNTAPVAVADAAITNEDTAIAVGVLVNDSDPNGDSLTIAAVGDPANGTAVLDDGGTPGDSSDDTIVYTPGLNFNGVDSFTYTLSDGVATTNGTVQVTVNAVNDAPLVQDDSAFTWPDTPLVLSVVDDLLANDSDPEGDPLSFDGFTQPANGTLIDNGDGALIYVPTPGYKGLDSFTYTATDGTDASAPATVAIQVGLPGGFLSDAFNSASLNGMWSLQGPVGSANLASDPQDAFLELVVPDGGTYDAWGASNSALRLMQDAVDADFGIEARFLSTPGERYQNQGILIEQDAQNWIRFDTFHDGTSLRILSAVTTDGVTTSQINQIIAAGDASHLRVTRSGDDWTYEYSADGQAWTTAVVFTHALAVTSVGPFAGSSDVAPGFTAQVDYFFNTAAPILPDDLLPPVAQDDTVATAAATALVLDVAGDLLANDSDPNGDPLALDSFTQPANGTLIDNGDGTLTYTPNGGFTGVDSFDYTISAGPDTATATVRVAVDNAAPLAQADTATTDEDTATVVAALANDSDPDGDILSVSAFTDPANGTVTIASNGALIYTPDLNFSGVDSFVYTVSDGLATDDATVFVTINPVNDPPAGQDDFFHTDPDTALVISVASGLLANDLDAEGDALSFVGFGQPANGTLVDNGDGTLTYAPDSGFIGVDIFTYTVSDGSGTDTADVHVTVSGPIDVWYGVEQTFGNLGEAQQWVNILGTVDINEVAGLSYSLNGGADRALSIGADTRRLQEPGDFNVDIDYDELDGSAVDDIVTIKATLTNGEVATQDVVVHYESGNTWSGNYSIDWETVTNIQDVAQVVDGQWTIDASGIRPTVQGYDRVFGIGDRTWDNYEVNLKITMHDLHTVDPRGRDGGGFGANPMWQGHTDDPVPNIQPKSGWEPSMGFWYDDDLSFGQYFGSGGLAQTPFTLQEGLTYNYKYRLEQANIFDRTHSLKIWEDGQAEPDDWTLQATDFMPEPVNGSFLFVAHYYDVTFGDVTVTEIVGSDIVFGDDGNDILLAVDLAQLNPGLGEIDVFTGGAGADTFVLGDASGTFYDDGDSGNAGLDDFAFIWDFQSGTDTIQLADVLDNYVLSDSPAGLPSGTAISHVNTGGPDELIGIVEGVFNLALDSSDFTFDPIGGALV